MIPSGQYLYTMETTQVTDLIPYKKKHTTFFNNQKRQIIEIGDFVVQEELVDGYLKRDTLYFAISKMEISGKDTVVQTERVELRKRLNFQLPADLHFQDNKIYVRPSPQFKALPFSMAPKTKDKVHPTDQNLYFKLESGESFQYTKNGFGFTLITIPFKVRLNTAPQDSTFTPAQARLDNMALMISYQNKKYRFENNRIRKTGLTVGPFIGPTVVRLVDQNEEATEKRQLGFQLGLGILGNHNRFNFGIGAGLDSVQNEKREAFKLDNKFFLGFVLGYSLNS